MNHADISRIPPTLKREIVNKFKWGAFTYNLACEYDLDQLEVEQIIREAWLAYENQTTRKIKQ